MKPTKSQINRIKMCLFKRGSGSKKEAATAIGASPSEITRLINGGTIKESKYIDLLNHLNLQ